MQLKHDVFISYSRSDSDFAEPFYQSLKKAGLNVWMDRSGIPGGSGWQDEIQKGIYHSRLFLVLISQASMTSHWVKMEINFASEQQKPLLPIELRPLEEGTLPHFSLSGIHRLSATDFQKEFDMATLVADVQKPRRRSGWQRQPTV